MAGRRTGRLIMTAAIALRIILVVAAGDPADRGGWAAWTVEPDSHTYLSLAADLSDGVQDSASTRTPAYPALLLLLTGGDADRTLPVVLAQQFMDVATALIIWALASRTGCVPGWPAAVFYLMLPAAAATSSRILPDTLVALIAAACSLVWLEAARTSDSRAMAGLYGATGLLLSAGALVKPVLMFAPAVFVLLVPFTRVRSRASRTIAVLALLASSAAGPALLYNHNRASFGMDAISAQDGYEQAGRIWILTGRITQEELVTSLKDSVDDLSMRDGAIDYDLRSDIYREMAREEFGRHPIEVIMPHLTSWPRFFSTGTGNTLRYLGLAGESRAAIPVGAATALMMAAMPAGFTIGLASRKIRGRLRLQLILAGAWMVVMSIVHGPLAGPRYGLTFFPALCAAAIPSLRLLVQSRKSAATYTNGTSAQ